MKLTNLRERVSPGLRDVVGLLARPLVHLYYSETKRQAQRNEARLGGLGPRRPDDQGCSVYELADGTPVLVSTAMRDPLPSDCPLRRNHPDLREVGAGNVRFVRAATAHDVICLGGEDLG